MPGTHTPPYPVEFRPDAIRLVRSRSSESVAQIARRIEVSPDTLRGWVKQADLDEGHRHDGLTTEEEIEVRRLPREVRRLREEKEILLKAAAYVAQETTGQIRHGDMP